MRDTVLYGEIQSRTISAGLTTTDDLDAPLAHSISAA
jgi:hypothetical protein